MAKLIWANIQKVLGRRWQLLSTIGGLFLVYIAATIYIYIAYPNTQSKNSWLSRTASKLSGQEITALQESESIDALPSSDNGASTAGISSPGGTSTVSDGGGDSGGASSDPSTASGNEGGDDTTESISAYVAFYADSQSDTDEEDARHLKVANEILASGANPIFHGGDLMEDGTQDSLNRFNNVAGGLVSSRSFYAALGNNDRTVGDSTTPSQLFLNNFVFPNNERWYSVNSGNLHMVVLDSAFCSSCSSQINWLISDLQSAASQSRITGIIFHHPSFVGTIDSYLVNNGVDFVVDGHTHGYAKTTSNGIYYFTMPGGGGLGYALASIYSSYVRFVVYNENGGVIDSQTFSAR